MDWNEAQKTLEDPILEITLLRECLRSPRSKIQRDIRTRIEWN